MDRLFTRMTERYVPKMNERIMKGLAVSALKDIEEYLDDQIRTICQGMPSCIRYAGYRRCTSQEEYEEVTRSRSQKRTYDIAQSSLFMVNYYFEFTDALNNKHEIVRPLSLPIVEEGGIITMSGSRHHIIPIISDKVLTPSQSTIFIKLTQDKNKAFRCYHSLMINGRREVRNVAWSQIYRNTKPTGEMARTKAETVLVHYLFAKYGFGGTFSRYAGIHPVVGHIKEITPENYPLDKWVIYSSTGKQPDTNIDRVYRRSNIAMAVPVEHNTQVVENLIVNTFYIIDHFPDRFEPRAKQVQKVDEDGVVTYVNQAVSHKEFAHEVLKRLDDIALWLILIGDIRFGDQLGDNKKYTDIRDHVETLDSYLDSVSKRRLEERGIFVENYLDLLHYVSANFNELIQAGNSQGLNVYGKTMDVLSYLLYDITTALTNEKFALNKVASRRPLTKQDVLSSLRKGLKTGAIYRITSGKIITKAVDYSGDHMYPGITSVLAEQESHAGAGRGENETTVVGPQHYLDLSMITLGSILNLPKKTPTPLARVNPWAMIDPNNGTVLENPKLKPLLDENAKWFKF